MLFALGRFAARESGLLPLYSTGRDAWLIILSRSCRMFAHGSSLLILALFFSQIHVSNSKIGLFMTLTLLGDVVLSLFLTLVADRVGRRRTLFFGSVSMVVSGATFALCENYWVLLLAAVVGVISVTGGDCGPFRAVEESILSELTVPATRADVLVWYVMFSTLSSSAGGEITGRIVEWLLAKDGWTLVDAYHACFWLNALMGAVNILISMLLSANCELPKKTPYDLPGETTPLLDASSAEGNTKGIETIKRRKTRLTRISRETRSNMYPLWFLLMVDSFAGGMASMSLTTYYMDQKFHLSKSTLGDFFSASYLLAGCATIFAGPLSRHVGLVGTMVFTHIPSSAAVLLFPLPASVSATFALLLIRVGLNNMDQAPRSVFITFVVKLEERTAVMGITTMLRTLAATPGPAVTGALAGKDVFWMAFVTAGALRLAYDLGLFAVFINIRLHKQEPVSAPNSECSVARLGDSNDEESEDRSPV